MIHVKMSQKDRWTKKRMKRGKRKHYGEGNEYMYAVEREREDKCMYKG